MKINGSGTKLLKSIENKRVVMDLEIKAKPSGLVGNIEFEIIAGTSGYFLSVLIEKRGKESYNIFNKRLRLFDIV